MEADFGYIIYQHVVWRSKWSRRFKGWYIYASIFGSVSYFQEIFHFIIIYNNFLLLISLPLNKKRCIHIVFECTTKSSQLNRNGVGLRKLYVGSLNMFVVLCTYVKIPYRYMWSWSFRCFQPCHFIAWFFSRAEHISNKSQ